jgi:hypothetical protein
MLRACALAAARVDGQQRVACMWQQAAHDRRSLVNVRGYRGGKAAAAGLCGRPKTAKRRQQPLT